MYLILAQKQSQFNKRLSTEKVGLRAEFADKNAILRRFYREIAAFDFYSTLYHGDDQPKIYAVDGRTYSTARPDDLPIIAGFRADLYIPPCDFFNGVYRAACLKKIYALILDLDYLDPDTLDRLIKQIDAGTKPQPSMIVNSGSGIHLYFTFAEPVDAYKLRLPTLRAMLARVGDLYSGYGKLDRHPLTQAFRPVGSLTKLGDIATGFIVGQQWDALELAEKIGVRIEGWQHVKKPAEVGTTAPAKKPAKPKVAFMPNAKRKLFAYCGERIFTHTDLGNRYKALFGLAIVGYKTHTPRAEVIAEMESLIKIWNRKHPENPVEMREIDKAMEGYSQKFLMVRSATLEEYFGWQFERKIPRRGRKRDEQLELARAVKDATQPILKRQAIAKYLKQNPTATTRQIAAALGMSLSTVGKYKKQIKP